MKDDTQMKEDTQDEFDTFVRWVPYVFALACFVFSIYQYLEHDPSAASGGYFLLAALAGIALPLAQEITIGKEGLVFKRIKEEVEKAQDAAEETKSAADDAAIRFKLTMVMGGRYGAGLESHRALLRVLDRAAGGDTIGPRDLRESFGDEVDHTEQRPAINVEILRELARVGILEINGEGLDVRATMPATRREVVKKAIAPFLTDEAPDRQ